MVRFLKIMGYEAKRILRNKVIFVMLLAFAVVMIVLLFFVQSANMDYRVAVYTDGLESPMEEDAISIIQLPVSVVYVDTEEEGMKMLRMSESVFFIRFYKAEEDGITRATLYYDGSSYVSHRMMSDLKDQKLSRAYQGILDYLSEWGITMDRAYFERVDFRSISLDFTSQQLSFVMEIAACVSVILLLGIAYSLARDRETNVGKNVAYIPIGHNTYFLSKLVPYFILGMLETLLLCVLGAKMMGITFQVNIFLVWALSSVFVMATLSIGLLFSLMKNQISTVFLSMMSMLLPLFVEMLVVTSALPTFVRVLLNFLPVTPFMQLFTCMIYNGVITWWNIPILLAQAVGYYLIALFVIRKQTH